MQATTMVSKLQEDLITATKSQLLTQSVRYLVEPVKRM